MGASRGITSIEDTERLELEVKRERFERLMAESWQQAFTLARQLSRNMNDADDLMQDTCLKAWRSFQQFQNDGPFINWVHRIMRRVFFDRMRMENPIRHAESLNSLTLLGGIERLDVYVSDESITPLEEIVTNELREEIHRAVAGLPIHYRAVITQCDLMGLSYADVASNIGVSLGTIRSRIHRGRRLVREALFPAM